VRGLRNDDSATRVERQLAMAQQITHVGSWEWDASTNSVFWSDELYRIYGLEPRSCEITFESFLARVHPEDREDVRRRVSEALQQGGRFAYDERIVRPDGSVRRLATVGEADRDDGGRVVGLIGTCRDVTEAWERDEMLQLYADIFRFAQIALSVWHVHDPDDPTSVRLVAFNAAAERAARRELAGGVGSSFRALFPYAAGGTFETALLDVARDGRVREAIVQASRDPLHPNRALALKTFPLPGGRVGMAIDDITAETKARRLRDAELRLLEMIVSGADLAAILSALVLAVEEHAAPAVGSVLLLDERGERLRHVAAPSLPAEYLRAVDGSRIGPAAGSCGTAAFLARPVFVEDVQTDRLWTEYRDAAMACGLRACSSTPIVATDGRVLGTFALYYGKPRLPSVEDRELIERATHLAGIAIERRQLEEQLRALSARVESIREDERTSIAREIHDDLGQTLTALKMDVVWMHRRIAGDDRLPTERLLAKLGEMSAMIDGIIGRVRRLSAELRPGVLDDLGLLAAIEWQAQEFQERTDTACVVESNLGDVRLDRDLSTAAFRIFQEALTNVARHARARRVSVRLERRGVELRLDVRDDGAGITREAVRNPTSLGLLGIRERARRLGGTVTIGPALPSGTLVSLALPLIEAGASQRERADGSRAGGGRADGAAGADGEEAP